MTAGIAWAVVESRKVHGAGWGILRWLGPSALPIIGWWMGGAAALGAIEIALDQLDAEKVVYSLIWSAMGFAVIAPGAITFLVTRHRGYEPPKMLTSTGLALLLAGLPALFLLAAATVI